MDIPDGYSPYYFFTPMRSKEGDLSTNWRVFTCERCGAAVTDIFIHDLFHDDLDRPKPPQVYG